MNNKDLPSGESDRMQESSTRRKLNNLLFYTICTAIPQAYLQLKKSWSQSLLNIEEKLKNLIFLFFSKKLLFFEEIQQFQFFFNVQQRLDPRLFELQICLGYGRASILSKEFIFYNFLAWRAVARALRAPKVITKNHIFDNFFWT